MKLRKILALLLCMGIVLTGCTQDNKDVVSDNNDKVNDQVEQTEGNDKKLKIGVSQLMQHLALDASRDGFLDELKNLGIDAEILEQNAQGDIPNTQVIADKFVKDKVDLIFAIATPPCQAAQKAVNGTEIPIVFTAVADPVYSGIVEAMDITDKNTTGVTNAAPIKENLELFLLLKEDIKSIGIIYNTGESNSQAQVDTVEGLAKDLGITIEKVGISVTGDIPQAVATVAKKAEGLYIITDNMVAASIPLVARLALENSLITVTADGSSLEEGLMMSNGVNYYDIGRQTAIQAKRILIDKIPVSEIPVEYGIIEKKVNVEVAQKLGYTKDHPAFEGAKFVE